jgi:hypothetical protein
MNERASIDSWCSHYSVRRNGRGFWEPHPHIRALGFSSRPCGRDGPDAWAIAEEWNRRWLAVRKGEAPSPAMASATNLSPEQAVRYLSSAEKCSSLLLLSFRGFARSERAVRIDVQKRVVRPAEMFSNPACSFFALKKIRAEIVRRNELFCGPNVQLGCDPASRSRRRSVTAVKRHVVIAAIDDGGWWERRARAWW